LIHKIPNPNPLQKGITSKATLSLAKPGAGFWQLNAFIILAIGCNLVNMTYYFIDNMPLSAYVEIAGMAVLATCIFCNMRGYFETSKLLSIVIVNLHAVLLCYIQGIAPASYLYLFPFILAMIFLLRIRKNNVQLWIYGSLTVATLIGILVFMKYENDVEKVPASSYYGHLLLNIVLNFLLTIVFFYFVLRLLDAKERKIKRDKAFTDTILNTSLDGVLIVNPETLVINQYNDKLAELFGIRPFDNRNEAYTVEEIMGRRMKTFIADLRLDEMKENGWQGDSRLTRKDNTEFHAFISILDITPIKLAEFETMKAREKAEKAAATKTRFMSNMSHELRTPLNAIIGTTHLLMLENPSVEQSENFKVLKNSSEHMLHLVNEVLDFSKLDAGKLEIVEEYFPLAPLLQETAKSFATIIKEKNIALVLELDKMPDEMQVYADAMRLKQVILNLLSNAIKFTHQGTVTLSTKVEQLTSDRSSILFSVSDTGIGIAADKLPLIFDSFTQADAETTRKYGGSGLGLSICRQLTQQMGGELKVESEVNKGSRFYFSLSMPVTYRKIVMSDNTQMKKLESLNGLRILLAEDNPVNMKIAKRFLDGWDAKTDVAENGLKALYLFKENKYDLLLIDLEMPEMDGKQFVTAVRQENDSIPAIAFTAAVYEDMSSDLKAHGFTSYIHKPFRPDDLHKKIVLHSTAVKQ
jgi:signal transduction histidine kinase/ActR/RegA family two-component response regulator